MTVAMRLKQTNVQEAGRECVASVIQMATLGALILSTFPTSSTVVPCQGSAALKPYLIELLQHVHFSFLWRPEQCAFCLEILRLFRKKSAKLRLTALQYSADIKTIGWFDGFLTVHHNIDLNWLPT
jgi:hypothetical protein